MYTKQQSQRNTGLFCKFCTSRACFHHTIFKNIMPSYLSITWRLKKQLISSRQDVGKKRMHDNPPVSACDIYSYTWKETSIFSIV